MTLLELFPIGLSLAVGYAICFYFTHKPMLYLYYCILTDKETLEHEVKWWKMLYESKKKEENSND